MVGHYILYNNSELLASSCPEDILMIYTIPSVIGLKRVITKEGSINICTLAMKDGS